MDQDSTQEPARRRRSVGCRVRVATLVESWPDDRSSIVLMFAMQALADPVVQDDMLRPHAIHLPEGCMKRGTAAIKSRGRKLPAQLRSL